MVHHIVMWKFKPEVEDAKKPELKKAMAENLKSLVGNCPCNSLPNPPSSIGRKFEAFCIIKLINSFDKT